MTTPTVAVAVPVMRRPDNVAPLVESFLANARDTTELVFVVDADDADEIAAIRPHVDDQVGMVIYEPDRPRAWDGPGTWAEKINYAYRRTTADWIFCGADDIRFHPGWLDPLPALHELGYGVVGTNDLGNPRVWCGQHATHFFVRRAYARRFGVVDQPDAILHEGYRHICADDECVQTAIARGAFAPCLTSIVEHLHPFWGKADDDDVYRRGREAEARDRQWWRVRLQLVRDEAARRAA